VHCVLLNECRCRRGNEVTERRGHHFIRLFPPSASHSLHMAISMDFNNIFTMNCACVIHSSKVL